MLRLLIALPFLAILVLFALSNGDPVRLGLWPTDYAITVPISVAVLAGMAIAFLFGALITWIGGLAQRQRARRAEARVRALDQQVEALRARLAQVTMALPPPA